MFRGVCVCLAGWKLCADSRYRSNPQVSTHDANTKKEKQPSTALHPPTRGRCCLPRKVLRGLIWQPPLWTASLASPSAPRLVLAAACLRPRRLAQGRYAFGGRSLRRWWWWCWWWWACCRGRCWWWWWCWSLSGSVACFRRVLRIGSSRRKFYRGLMFPLFNGCSRFVPRGGHCPPHPIRTFFIFFSRARRAGDTPTFKRGVPYRGCAPRYAPLPPMAVVGLLPRVVLVVLVVMGVLASLGR